MAFGWRKLSVKGLRHETSVKILLRKYDYDMLEVVDNLSYEDMRFKKIALEKHYLYERYCMTCKFCIGKSHKTKNGWSIEPCTLNVENNCIALNHKYWQDGRE